MTSRRRRRGRRRRSGTRGGTCCRWRGVVLGLLLLVPAHREEADVGWGWLLLSPSWWGSGGGGGRGRRVGRSRPCHGGLVARGGCGEEGVGRAADDGLVVEGHALLGAGRHQFGAV